MRNKIECGDTRPDAICRTLKRIFPLLHTIIAIDNWRRQEDTADTKPFAQAI